MLNKVCRPRLGCHSADFSSLVAVGLLWQHLMQELVQIRNLNGEIIMQAEHSDLMFATYTLTQNSSCVH